MTDQELDQRIFCSLLDAAAIERERDLKQLEEVTFRPSLHHRRSMNAMLKDPMKWRRNRGRPLWKRMVQTAASVLLVLVVTFAVIMAVSPTARAVVKNWIMKWYENDVEYSFSDEITQGNPADFELTYVPEGYVELNRLKHPIYQYVLYKNNEGNFVRFESQVMKEGNATAIETKTMKMSEIDIQGHHGELYLSKDASVGNVIIWRNTKANLQFSIQGFIGESTLIAMAESVELS